MVIEVMRRVRRSDQQSGSLQTELAEPGVETVPTLFHGVQEHLKLFVVPDEWIAAV